jgi:hypothetical protein
MASTAVAANLEFFLDTDTVLIPFVLKYFHKSTKAFWFFFTRTLSDPHTGKKLKHRDRNATFPFFLFQVKSRQPPNKKRSLGARQFVDPECQKRTPAKSRYR